MFNLILSDSIAFTRVTSFSKKLFPFVSEAMNNKSQTGLKNFESTTKTHALFKKYCTHLKKSFAYSFSNISSSS